MKFEKKFYEERYYIGVELEGGVDFNNLNKVGEMWDVFLQEDIKLLSDVELANRFIGLECYPPDFMETRSFDYYAMVQTKELVDQDGFVSKKLPRGTYIAFEVEFDRLRESIEQVYEYLNNNKIKVHMSFDFEDYLPTEDYTKPGAILNFSFLLDES